MVNLADIKETAVNYIIGEEAATFYTAEKSYINSINKWLKEYPNDIEIKYKNKDGSLICHIPKSWIKIKPPRKISEQQKKNASERFKKMWEQKKLNESDFEV